MRDPDSIELTGTFLSLLVAEQTNIELNPKWLILSDILREICRSDSDNNMHANQSILILVGRENTARSLERFLRRGPRAVRRFLRDGSHVGDSYKPSEPKVGFQRKLVFLFFLNFVISFMPCSFSIRSD